MSEPSVDEPWSPAHNPYAIAVSEVQFWTWTLDLCARRVREGVDPARQLDARLFVIALRQVPYAGDMQQREIAGLDAEVRKALGEARGRFEQAVPGCAGARDILVHFDEYARGQGRQQRRARDEFGIDAVEAARRYWGGGYNPATGCFTAGPHSVHIERAREAAHRFADAIYMAAKAIDRVRARTAPAG